MDTREREGGDRTRGTGAEPGQDTGGEAAESRLQAANFYETGARAIATALSTDSETFLLHNRQEGGE